MSEQKKIDDGGPASSETRRQQLARDAMKGMLSNPAFKDYDDLVKWAYMRADEMIAYERAEVKGKKS